MTRKEARKAYRLEKKEIKTNYRLKKKALKEELKITNDHENYVKKKIQNKQERKTNIKNTIQNYVYIVNVVANVTPSKDAPYRYLLEEIGNAVSHGVGSVFSIVALVLMMICSKNHLQVIAGIVYFFGLFMMFTMSTLYHSFPYGSKAKRVFRRFDYTSIYLLIGATYAPILLLYLEGSYGMIFFIIQWIIIIIGVTLVSIFGPGKLKWLNYILYIMLGWSAIIFLPKMIMNDFGFFLFIFIGGLLYTGGIIPFSIDKKVSHFLWHLFVFLGAIVQWIGIFIYLF